ncbi:hypothetical protein NCCP133_16790 [Cytobacillus sp. NCCP-133]|nr:hypothetical protein NCCP133_16790 [Cytobacillus sp. NCCP-133]
MALFESMENWEKELEAVKEGFSSVTKYKGRLKENANVLLHCLEARENLLERFNLVSMYADLRLSGSH